MFRGMNRFSFVVLALVILLVVGLTLFRNRVTGTGLAAVVFLGIALALLGYLFRYRQTPIGSLKLLEKLMREKPILLEFYSDY